MKLLASNQIAATVVLGLCLASGANAQPGDDAEVSVVPRLVDLLKTHWRSICPAEGGADDIPNSVEDQIAAASEMADPEGPFVKQVERVRTSLKLLASTTFFCAEDLRTKCDLGPEQESCPEIRLRECAECFTGGIAVDRDCLCDCEKENEAVKACVGADDTMPAVSEEADEKALNNQEEAYKRAMNKDEPNEKMLAVRRRNLVRNGVKRMLGRVGKCLKDNKDTLTDTCKAALADLKPADDEDAPEDAAETDAVEFMTAEASRLQSATEPEDGDSSATRATGSAMAVVAMALAARIV